MSDSRNLHKGVGDAGVSHTHRCGFAVVVTEHAGHRPIRGDQSTSPSDRDTDHNMARIVAPGTIELVQDALETLDIGVLRWSLTGVVLPAMHENKHDRLMNWISNDGGSNHILGASQLGRLARGIDDLKLT